MSLSREVYRELEDIIGPENLSEDEAVLDAYSAYGFGSRGPKAEDRYYTRPEVVALPGSTEDVQAIVKLSNRRGLKVKASSTGYGPHNAAGSAGVILLDMRRMNRILEIDEKNMRAVVEPYVSFAQLQAEAMKKGLNCHVIGAGSNCSALASTTSMHGTNTQAISQGWGGRNLIGAEWVLPTGDVLKLGSLGSASGYYSADGPGPSLRGILRGAAGAQAGIGVFTKCAIHLHPWPGPAEIELKGTSPYFLMDVPPLFEYHMIEWPTWEQCADAQLKIGEAGIAFAFHKTGGPGSHGAVVTGNNNEYYDKWEELKDLPWISYALVTHASSSAEQAYQVKVLDKILEETEGKILPLGERDDWKQSDIINMIKGCFIPRLAFRVCGSFCCPLQGQDSVDHCAMALSLDRDFRKKYEEQELIFNDGTNNMWGVMFEGSRFALFECGHLYSPTEEDSWAAGARMAGEGRKIALEKPLCFSWTVMGNDVVREYGPMLNNLQNWQVKIKLALDPNIAIDPAGYISPEEETFGIHTF